MVAKIKKWLFKPLVAIRPQTAPIGIIAILILALIGINWPLNENTIELWEIFMAIGIMAFIIGWIWLSEWYKDNKNQ